MNIIIDPEFESMLGKLSKEEYHELTKSIEHEGVRVPIVIWKKAGSEDTGIILDGHNRFEIANRLNKDCPKRFVHFQSRELAARWIIRNQLSRRNLKDEKKTYYLGLLYNLEKQDVGNPQFRHFDGIGSTAERLAETHGVAKRTVERAGEYASAVETLETALPGTKEKALHGDVPKQHVVEAAKAALHGNIDKAKAVLDKSKEASDKLKAEFKAKNEKKLKELPVHARARMLLDLVSLPEAIDALIDSIPPKDRLREITAAIKSLKAMSIEIQQRKNL